MATTKQNKVGQTRVRLADLLEQAIDELIIFPEDLESQIPVYASPEWDCCSWYGDGKDRNNQLPIHIASWSTMGECVRYGIDVSRIGRFEWEVSSQKP